MSVSLYVGLNGPLKVEDFVEDTVSIFYEMTRFDIEEQVEVFQLDGGNYSNVTQSQLTCSSSPALELREKSLGEVQLYIFTDDDEPTLISINPIGEQRSQGARVLAATCAIAIARRHESEIENNQMFWGPKSDYTAEELFNLLKCRRLHTSAKDAVTEVLENIKKAKRES